MFSTSTTQPNHQPTLAPAADDHESATTKLPTLRVADDLNAKYLRLLKRNRQNWTMHYRLVKLLGSGGQGVVYLAEQRGSDAFTIPVALKMFDPGRHRDARTYEEAMRHVAAVSARVALINQDNLLDVHHFMDPERIRMMVMEWIDGFDLRRLLTLRTLEPLRAWVTVRRWEYINNVLLTAGPEQTRFKPGPAVAIVRQCLAALAALHREGIVHGDIKPSNLMLKRTGAAKIIDIGSAFDYRQPPLTRNITPLYAAPEALQNEEMTPRSDLASLGYMLIEMLSGRQLFNGLQPYEDLLAAKLQLPRRLHELLPRDVTRNELLMSFCRRLIAPDPMQRFPDADAAVLRKEGAAAFLRQLVRGDMSSEFEEEVRQLMEELKQLDDFRQRGTG